VLPISQSPPEKDCGAQESKKKASQTQTNFSFRVEINSIRAPQNIDLLFVETGGD
jgi:hypothetical protein